MSIADSPAGHEFSDRLNPFLVKELRQGLRGRTYLALYLLLILALTIHALFSRDIGTEFARNAADDLFRVVTGFTLTALLPLNLLGAIHEERRGRKIELVMLSRVNARGVVVGKWLVATLQAMTLASLVVPFVVIRYFSGGLNLLDDICFLATTLVGGMIFGAATLCASSFIREGMPVLGFLTRAGIIGAGLFFGGAFVGVMNDMVSRSYGDIVTAFGVALIALALCVPVLLEIAAAQLAPEAVNHDGVVRTMGVVGAGLALVAIRLWASPGTDKTEMSVILPFVFALVCGTFTLFRSNMTGLAYRTPLDRLGVVGKTLGKVFLIPGWASGLAFMLLVPIPALVASHAMIGKTELSAGLMALWGAIVWPLAITGPFFRNAGMRFGAWLVLQVVAILISIMIMIRAGAAGTWGSFDCFIPTTGLIIRRFDTAFHIHVAGFAVTYAAACVALAVEVMRRRRA